MVWKTGYREVQEDEYAGVTRIGSDEGVSVLR